MIWRRSGDFETFWPILEENLWTVHRVRAVHTLVEIGSLQRRFPDNIKLFGAFLGDAMLAGIVIYESDTVAHAQYTASTPEGRTGGALDVLFDGLLHEEYANKPYFDFGVSTESEGRQLNRGLVEFKEGFGARTIVHDFYEVSLTANFSGS